VKSADNGVINPSKSTERIQDVDILRGFALFGVILVNVFYFHVPAQYFSEYYNQFTDPLNKGLFYFLSWFFTGKFYPIFSFLFGLGFSIQFLNARQKNVNPYTFLARRLTILLLFGLAHIIFVWEEDILFIYAVCGFVLLALAERSPKFILATALALYFAPHAFNVANNFFQFTAHSSVMVDSFNTYVDFYTTAPYWQILRERIAIYLQKFSQLEVLISQLNRLAFFLMGLYVGRNNYIAAFRKESRYWFRLLLISFCIFSAGFLADKIWLKDLENARYPALLLSIEEIVIGITSLFQVFIYIIGFLLLLTVNRIRPFLTPLSNIGRTALTIYLMHSTVFSFIFYSFGLKLYGSLIPTQLFTIALGLFSVDVILSILWLKYFQYGPLEWAWRSLTYNKVLPIRIRGA